MSREYHGILLTESFGDDDRAIAVLRHYFKPLSGENAGFTGGAWDTFDPSGSRASTSDEFTAEDLVACALLSAPIPGRAAIDLLDRRKDHFAGLLEGIGPDKDFIEAGDPDGPGKAALNELFWDLRGLPGVGLTRTTKLLARKRPRMVPIVDGVLKKVVFNGGSSYWGPLHRALIAEDHALWGQLERLKVQADLPSSVPTVRVFDVLAWMDGTGNSDRVIAGSEIRASVRDEDDEL